MEKVGQDICVVEVLPSRTPGQCQVFGYTEEYSEPDPSAKGFQGLSQEFAETIWQDPDFKCAAAGPRTFHYRQGHEALLQRILGL